MFRLRAWLIATGNGTWAMTSCSSAAANWMPFNRYCTLYSLGRYINFVLFLNLLFLLLLLPYVWAGWNRIRTSQYVSNFLQISNFRRSLQKLQAEIELCLNYLVLRCDKNKLYRIQDKEPIDIFCSKVTMSMFF